MNLDEYGSNHRTSNDTLFSAPISLKLDLPILSRKLLLIVTSPSFFFFILVGDTSRAFIELFWPIDTVMVSLRTGYS